MSNEFTTILFIVGGIVAGYYLVLFILFRKKIVAFFGKPSLTPAVGMTGTAAMELPHQLIDRPLAEAEPALVLTGSHSYPEAELEMVEDEDSHLLKAAEIVVEKVQDIVSHIASHPPNPEEVFTKIQAVVNQYGIFRETDYYEAINSFIALTVERDCAIRFSKEELVALWN